MDRIYICILSWNILSTLFNRFSTKRVDELIEKCQLWKRVDCGRFQEILWNWIQILRLECSIDFIELASSFGQRFIDWFIYLKCLDTSPKNVSKCVKTSELWRNFVPTSQNEWLKQQHFFNLILTFISSTFNCIAESNAFCLKEEKHIFAQHHNIGCTDSILTHQTNTLVHENDCGRTRSNRVSRCYVAYALF